MAVFECQCGDCRSACTRKPGWFRPGEVEALAISLNMSLSDLFKQKLAVDWWCEDEGLPETFLISPALKHHPAGEELPSVSLGECVFYNDGQCEIHAAGKPFECSALTHDISADRSEIAREWGAYQEGIAALLGREPEAAPFTIFDMLETWGR